MATELEKNIHLGNLSSLLVDAHSYITGAQGCALDSEVSRCFAGRAIDRAIEALQDAKLIIREMDDRELQLTSFLGKFYVVDIEKARADGVRFSRNLFRGEGCVVVEIIGDELSIELLADPSGPLYKVKREHLISKPE